MSCNEVLVKYFNSTVLQVSNLWNLSFDTYFWSLTFGLHRVIVTKLTNIPFAVTAQGYKTCLERIITDYLRQRSVYWKFAFFQSTKFTLPSSFTGKLRLKILACALLNTRKCYIAKE